MAELKDQFFGTIVITRHEFGSGGIRMSVLQMGL